MDQMFSSLLSVCLASVGSPSVGWMVLCLPEQTLWRCYAAEKTDFCPATWKMYVLSKEATPPVRADNASPHIMRLNLSVTTGFVLPTAMGDWWAVKKTSDHYLVMMMGTGTDAHTHGPTRTHA